MDIFYNFMHINLHTFHTNLDDRFFECFFCFLRQNLYLRKLLMHRPNNVHFLGLDQHRNDHNEAQSRYLPPPPIT